LAGTGGHVVGNGGVEAGVGTLVNGELYLGVIVIARHVLDLYLY